MFRAGTPQARIFNCACCITPSPLAAGRSCDTVPVLLLCVPDTRGIRALLRPKSIRELNLRGRSHRVEQRAAGGRCIAKSVIISPKFLCHDVRYAHDVQIIRKASIETKRVRPVPQRRQSSGTMFTSFDAPTSIPPNNANCRIIAIKTSGCWCCAARVEGGMAARQ